MILEIDQVVVDAKLWARAKDGDEAAKGQIAFCVHGLDLYMHNFPVQSDDIVVTLRELEDCGIIDGVSIEVWGEVGA